MRNIKEFNVYKNSVKFFESVYSISSQRPSKENIGLKPQMNSAVVSISSNISEVSEQRTDTDSEAGEVDVESVSYKTDNHKRVLSIDIFRGFALVFMVLVHFGIFYGNEDVAYSYSIFFLDHILAEWGAAAFLMMMGMSQVLSAKRIGKPDNWLLFKKALVRGTYIFVVGLVMLVIAWGPDDIWWWDILTLIGFATIVLFFCRFLPTWSLIGLVVVIMVATPYLRDVFNVAADWEFIDAPMISQWIPGIYIEPVVSYHNEILKGLFLSGYFPVFPWIAFIIIGFVIGRRIVAQKMQRDLPVLLLTGVVLTSLGFILGYAGRAQANISASISLISPLCFYPDSFSLINIQAGISILVFTMVYFFFDIRKKDKSKLGIFSRLFSRTSNFSLTFYFLHYMLLAWPFATLYLITGKYMLGDLMDPILAILCGVVSVALLEILIFYWGKADSRYSLEWFLVKLTKRVVPGYKRSVSLLETSSKK